MAVIHYTIATEAEKSADFRRVLWTGRHTQLVIMTLPVGGEIGDEVHEDTDQILTFVSGTPSDTTYITELPHRYYFVVKSANVDWTMVVEEAVLK